MESKAVGVRFIRRRDIDTAQVVELYCDQGLSCIEVSRRLGCDRATVKCRLGSVGIPLRKRSMSEHVRAGMMASVPLSSDMVSILDGELLGDGHLNSPAGFQAYFSESVGNSKREWLEYIMRVFRSHNILIKNSFPYLRQSKGDWSFNTRSTVEFGDQHRRWYIKNDKFDPQKPRNFSNRMYIKSVPVDVALDKHSLLYWFIGDGTNKVCGSKICTNGFAYDEVEFLRYRLLDLFRIETSHLREGAIGLPKPSVAKILEIIGPCPVECYGYKWDLSVKKHHRPRNPSIDIPAVDRFLATR